MVKFLSPAHETLGPWPVVTHGSLGSRQGAGWHKASKSWKPLTAVEQRGTTAREGGSFAWLLAGQYCKVENISPAKLVILVWMESQACHHFLIFPVELRNYGRLVTRIPIQLSPLNLGTSPVLVPVRKAPLCVHHRGHHPAATQSARAAGRNS